MPLLSTLISIAAISMTQPYPHSHVLDNGLVRREITLAPCVATTSLIRLDSGHEFVRTAEPEAIVTIDGKEWWLGGCASAPNRAFSTPEWLEALVPNEKSIALREVNSVAVSAEVPHKAEKGQAWPPKGKAIALTFANSSIQAIVRHEIYDGIPVVAKQVEIKNVSSTPITIDSIISERLAAVEGESNVEMQKDWRLPDISVFTTMSFGGKFDSSIHWTEDTRYGTQVSYELKTPCMLNVHPPIGPKVVLKPGETYRSIKSFLVVHGPTDRESQSLERRKFFRTLAPWTLDNPLMLHVRSNDDKEIRTAIDQAAECGFEMVIMSFGSGLNMEDTSPQNIARFRVLREYANARGVRFGGYSLLASRRIDDANDVINPKTGKTGGAIFGNSPCLCSKWGLDYFERIKKFISETGFQLLEHDGNYPGDVCASTTHPGHRGLEDSQWMQHKIITDFYRWCRERGIYLNVPDMYFLSGSNKTGMGYRETNWSLPRSQQHVHARQNIYDGTWDKTPSMGWMFVPLVEYHGGGPEATIEPLKDHLADYELHFANTFANGVQACWRGTRLYDSPETKAVVVRMVNWYKKYRELLESDTVHFRRPDGRRLDYVVKINPRTSPQMMVAVFNPTQMEMVETITLPVGAAHFRGRVEVQRAQGKAETLNVVDDKLKLKVSCPGRQWTYYTVTSK